MRLPQQINFFSSFLKMLLVGRYLFLPFFLLNASSGGQKTTTINILLFKKIAINGGGRTANVDSFSLFLLSAFSGGRRSATIDI